ncbi:MAG: S9 family peptidase [Candidatus Sungbacteria bacterium]|nr:S9 family peptidase [Candidatus Sungbacteria bacterium]
MQKKIFYAVAIYLLLVGTVVRAGDMPETRIENVCEIMHAVEVCDPYQWLESDASEVKQWVDEQNRYAASQLSGISQRTAIRKRLADLYKSYSRSLPYVYGNRYFFSAGGSEQRILYVQEGEDGTPRVLIDPNALSEKAGKTISLGGWNVSRDGKLLAYGLSDTAGDAKSRYVLKVDSGENLSDVIPSYLFPYVNDWAYDGSGFYYTRRPSSVPAGEEKYHQKLYFHRLGTLWQDDTLLCCEGLRKEAWPWARVSDDGQWLLVSVMVEARKHEIFLKDLSDDAVDLIPVIRGVSAEFYSVIHGQYLYILTNHEAPLWKIMRVKIEDVSKGMDAWQTVIPEGTHGIEGMHIFGDQLFVKTLENVSSRFTSHTLEGQYLRTIPLPVLGSLDGFSYEPRSQEFFFGFSSFFFPYTVYRYDLESENYEKLWGDNVSGVDPTQFDIWQIWYSSKDGTGVPMFLMHKKGLARDGNNPTLLYGYGGFGISITPYFDKDMLMFLERGGVYAIANLRGGGEFGEKWHEAGQREKKQNVFDDFIAAAEWLIRENYTNPERLAIFGWSNGGLLTAAALTQRSDLFKAVIIGAPVLDMVRFVKFVGGRYWINDYGDPDDPAHFSNLLAYSPYHNVRDGVFYPATLILIADTDDRVHPLHAYKMAARLQAANASDNPILLRVEKGTGGHGGATTMSRKIEMNADKWSFIFLHLNIE